MHTLSMTPTRRRLAVLCSTPFGDIDECTHQVSASVSGDELTCSTPFGDIDECTRDRQVKIPCTGYGMCSTPFGDIDECTPGKGNCPNQPSVVLNAFRRH